MCSALALENGFWHVEHACLAPLRARCSSAGPRANFAGTARASADDAEPTRAAR